MALLGVNSQRPRARTAAGLISCLILVGVLGVGLKLGTSHPSAQGPTPDFQTGKNVDIVGPHGTVPYDPAGSNPFLLGDPDKKQQNEPSCDISPNNPLIVFCGMNSYSAVDRPKISGEPWVGAAFTMDGGLTWKSHLHPGFQPKDSTAPAPLAPPNGYETAADPVVRLAPGIGLFLYIAFNRDGAGALLMGRWFERTIESGFPYGWKDTVQVAKGTASPPPTGTGRFVDKPAMTLSLLPVLPGTQPGTFDFQVPDPTPAAPNQTRIQKVPAGIVHVSYAVFTGNSEQDGVKIIHTRSTNYGDNWGPTTSLSESQSINQAPDIATDPATRRVVVVWRRFANPTASQTDAIMSAISLDDGKSFGKPTVVANICSFTQGTTSASFRTTTHPFVTFDGTAFHAIWAVRQGSCGATPTGYSRIVMSNLSFNGTPKWSTPAPVDTASSASRRGHEFLPAIAAAGNRILVTWLDTRNDVRVGEPFPDPIPDPHVNDYVFAGKTKVRRRSADIFAAEAFAGQTPTFGLPKQVSRYLFGVFPGNPTPQALERSKVNARMFQTGKVPFLGDYTTAASVRFVLEDPILKPNVWVSSVSPAVALKVQPVFQLAWTDNRLVRGDVSAGLGEATGSPYTPPTLAVQNQSEPDPTTPRDVECKPLTVGTRDQSVFSARITPPIVLLTASASKPTLFSDATGTHRIRRSYAIVVRNTLQTAAGDKTVSLEIGGTSKGATASFRKITPEFPAALTTLTGVALPHRSSIARTVYVESPESLERPVVQINVLEPSALPVTVYLNANGNAAPLDDPEDPNQRITGGEQVDSIELHTPDIVYRATSIGTPAIDDPAIDDPAIDDPAIDDPAIDDPAIDDPAIDDPAIDDPAIDDPAIDDPAIDDPAIDDPAIDDPAIDDASVAASSIFDPDTSTGTNNSGQKLTQITWKIALKGNTTTSMTSKVFLAVTDAKLAALKQAIGPGKSQLLVSRRYRTSDLRGAGCSPVRVSSYQVIANVVDPVLTNNPAPPNLVNPESSEPSFAIAPGDAVYLTFRVRGNVPEFSPGRVGAVVQSQPGPPASEPLDDDTPPPDLVAPTLILPGAPNPGVTAEATSPAGAVVTYTVTANDDADGTVPVACSKASGSTFPIGTTPVTCSATDSSGNLATGTFNVVVADTTAPTVTVPANIVAEAASAAGAAVAFSASATDLIAGALTPTCSPASGATFPLGVTTVTCSASDGTNTGTASFTVTVRDTVSPVITGTPGNMTVFGGPSGAVVTYTVPTAVDAISGPRPVSCSPASGSTFVGTTVVTCSASDTALPPNTATTTFTVTVTLDAVGPTITISASPMTLWPPDGAQVTVTVSGIANDANSGVARISWSVVDEYRQVQPSGSIPAANGAFTFPIVLVRDRRGNDKDGRHYTIRVTATDHAGNVTAAAPIVVNVHDQSGG